MTRRFLIAVLIALTLAAGIPTKATSCPPHDPSAWLTTDCTFLVVQYDPGVWIDQKGSYWATVPGVIFPVNVGTDPSVLHIGRK